MNENTEPGQAQATPTGEAQNAAAQTPEAQPAGNGPPNPQKPNPPAGPAKMRKRHWRLILSLILLVFLPFASVSVYLWGFAEDQYGSVTGFTVRQEEGGSASSLVGGLAQLAGTSSSPDGDILYEFILSHEMVRKINSVANLRAHYSQHWESDPAFSIWPDPSIEDLVWYWRRIVRISYDQASGLMEVRVLAFDPEKAQEIAELILKESQLKINALNRQLREDAMGYANRDLEEAIERLKDAREALTSFRSRTQILDPEADIRGRMGVMNNLQQKLADALIAYDLLLETTGDNDPRIAQAKRQVEVIRERISQERQTIAEGEKEQDDEEGVYPALLAEYEGLVVDREFAEETYGAALTAVDLARDKAMRQSRYLATYIAPTLAETAEYPQRTVIASLSGLFLLMSWTILALVYYSIRDRR